MKYNNNELSVSVTLGDGYQMMMDVKPYEAIVDDNGYVRMFSMEFDDGRIGNFKLLPNNQTKSAILNFCADVLTPLGVRIAGNELINHESEIITNLGRYVFGRFTTPPIQDFFRYHDIIDSAYYALDNGEKVIAHPVKLYLL